MQPPPFFTSLYNKIANKSRCSLVYHPQLVAVYHQNEVLYIIKPQEDARWRVMRYNGGKPPLMIYAALRASMICQDCGLDKQKQSFYLGRQMFCFCCQRAVKRCVNAGKNSKKYTKSKLFNASKKVRFVLWDKRLHICFTCAKRNYTFQKTSVIISPDIYLQGIFGQFLFIWIFILLWFFCKINYV